MNPIVFALRHPYTVMVGVLALVLGSGLVLYYRMKIDIFPSLNLPVVYVAQPYGGLDPAQMEGLITNYYEYHFLYINGIHHVESKSVQGAALMKLYFHPDTDMSQALAETVGYVNRSRAFMPPGTVPPFIMRFDTGSVPVGYLVLRSETKTIGEIQDQALFRVRPMFASLPGVSAPPPFGGNQRAIVVKLDPDRLQAYRLSPEAVIAALTSGNTIAPSGNARIKDQMPIVSVNAMVKDPKELGTIPVRPEADVFLRDIATIEDSTDIPTGYALVNGKRAVYILVTKRANASTLSVVNEVKKNLPRMRAVLPDDIQVSFEFDQSPYVTGAMWGVLTEGLLGAVLTGLTVLLFLRDWRSVIVVVLNIPFALLGSVVALWLTGQTVNMMTLGGLALAIGILVDEATVEVENIHTQFEHTPNIARAVRLGNAQTAVPRLLAMLCILAVFIPSFFMEGSARALFVPMSLAVGFSMVASYILSSTFVPVLSVWLLRVGSEGRGARNASDDSFFDRLRGRYEQALRSVMRLRWLMFAGYPVVAGLLIGLVGWHLGTDIFPRVDSGQFQLRLRAADGTRLEITEELAQQALEVINDEAGTGEVAISVGYVGLIGTSYPINTVYQWMRGPEEAVLRVKLKQGSHVRVAELERRLRERLPERLEEWLRLRLVKEGLTPDQIEQRVRGLSFSFEPADIINEVMSFGSPTPVEIAVRGKNLAADRDYADRVLAYLKREVSSLRDIQISQSLDYPAVEVKLDRARLGQSNVTVTNISNSLVAATSSSRFVVPNYWADPASGIGYQVQVEIPPFRMDSIQKIGDVLVKDTPQGQVLLRNMAQIRPGSMPGEYDRYNMTRLVSMTANIEGEDLGRVAGHIAQTLNVVNDDFKRELGDKRFKDQFGAVTVELRGQVVPMEEMFSGLGRGLVLAVVAILLLLIAYFQSIRLALISISAVPAVIAGVAIALLVTGTTLNIQSFMGAIMAIGVAVANSILLTTFAEENRKAGASAAEAAIFGAESRLRPILMTSCAMLAGMIPMALALLEGGEQTAPLARAVIGGLVASTLATLIVLPSVFAVVQGRSSTASVSLDPEDPESRYYSV